VAVGLLRQFFHWIVKTRLGAVPLLKDIRVPSALDLISRARIAITLFVEVPELIGTVLVATVSPIAIKPLEAMLIVE